MKIEYAQVNYICTEGERDNDGLLRIEMERALIALRSAYSGFDNVTDPDLIDCYIYQVNSALKRYRYLLHQAQLLHPDEEPDEKLKNANDPYTKNPLLDPWSAMLSVTESGP